MVAINGFYTCIKERITIALPIGNYAVHLLNTCNIKYCKSAFYTLKINNIFIAHGRLVAANHNSVRGKSKCAYITLFIYVLHLSYKDLPHIIHEQFISPVFCARLITFVNTKIEHMWIYFCGN